MTPPPTPWSGPARYTDHKRPPLDQLENIFRSGRRVLALHSGLAPSDAEDEARGRCRIATVSALSITDDPAAQPDPAAAPEWRRHGTAGFRHRRLPHVGLWTGVVPGPDGRTRAAFQLYGGDRDAAASVREEVLARCLEEAPAGADVRPPSGTVDPQPQRVDVEHAADVLARRPLVVLTGAGVSAGAGIMPFFGSPSLDDQLGLLESPAGRFEHDAIADPDSALSTLAEWHLSFLAAEPCPAHHAIVDLEARGHVAMVLTTNIDRLHQIAGQRRVVQTGRIRRANPPPGAGVLVLGAANDTHGAIARARETGGAVVCVDATPPSWIRPEDHWIPGDPGTTVVELAHLVPGIRTPLAALPPDRLHEPGDAVAPLPTVTDTGNRHVWDRLPALADLVRARAWHPASKIHGPRHWLTVGWIGARIARDEPTVDPLVVALFAMLHDCRRVHDGADRIHGHRAAEEALELLGEASWLTPRQLDTLRHACALHSDGHVSDDPTVGACWDADRLDLWRVGATPEPTLLSLGRSRQLAGWSRLFTEVARTDAAWDDWRPLASVFRSGIARAG